MKIYMAGYTAKGNVRKTDSEPGSPRRLISYSLFLSPANKANFESALAVVEGDWDKFKMISKKKVS